MKVIVCGSRDWTDYKAVCDELDLLKGVTFVIEGGATGADALARKWAFAAGVPVAEVPANWDRYGKGAGSIRNSWMLKLSPDLVVAFHKDGSRGTADMIRQAEAAGIPVRVVRPRRAAETA